MTGDSEEALISIAKAVADGSPVDWEQVSEGRLEDAGKLRSLKGIAEVAAAWQTINKQAGGGANTGGADETLAGGPRLDGSRSSTRHASWGPLQILERVGRGGFGEVSRAYDPNLDREVALKLRRRTEPGPDSDGDRFITEARRLARVRHENVLVVHGADRHDGHVGIWAEFLKGKTLEQWLKEHGPLGAQEATLIGIDLCRALAAVHRARLVHRDVKSANVMREEGGRIVLMDFGCVGERAPAGDSDQSGNVYGTPLYMAPEQLAGAGPTAAADIYSLGVLLYNLTTGAYPVEAGSTNELTYKHARGDSMPLRDRRPELPAAFIQVVERAVSPRPEDRYPSAGVMERALTATVGGGVPAPPPHPVNVVKIAVTLTLALALVVVSWTQWPRMRPWLASTFGLNPNSPTPARTESESTQTPVGSGTSTSPGTLPMVNALTASATLYRISGTNRERLLPGARVEVGDRLLMEVQGSRPMYVYILNEDSEGKVFALFPLRGVVPRNPLPANLRHTLPGRIGDKEFAWAVSSAGGTESLIALASAQPLAALEEELAHIPEAQRGQEPAYAQISASGVQELRGKLRGIGKLEPMSGPEGPSDSRLSQMVQKLSQSVSGRTDLWLWQMQLKNPKE